MSRNLGNSVLKVVSGVCAVGMLCSVGALFYVKDSYKKKTDELNYKLYEATKNSLGKEESNDSKEPNVQQVVPNEYDEVTITKEQYDELIRQSKELQELKNSN